MIRRKEKLDRYNISIEFVALTAATMISNIYRDFMPYKPVEVHRRFEGTYCPIFMVEEYDERAAIKHTDSAFLL
jgi:hypothetical protein